MPKSPGLFPIGESGRNDALNSDQEPEKIRRSTEVSVAPATLGASSKKSCLE